MLDIDLKTIIVAMVIINMVCFIVMLRSAALNRRKYAGLNYWCISWGLQVVSILLIALRGVIPDWASIVLSNSLIALSFLLFYFGFCRFFGKKNSRLFIISIWLFLGIFIFNHFYFTYIDNRLLARDYNLSIGSTLGYSLNLWLLFKGINKEFRSITLGPKFAFAFLILIGLLRITGYCVFPQTHNEFFKSGTYESLMVLFLIGGYAFLTFSLVLLINRRLLKESVQSENTLLASEAKYRDLYENAPVAYLSVGLDETIKTSNQAACQLFGYTRDEIEGKNRNILYSPEYLGKGRILFEKAKKGERVENEDIVYKRKDGSRFYGLLSITPENDLKGEIISYRSVIRDITELKKAEAKSIELESLKVINQAKSDLLANVSHELRTPLTSIKGNIESLIEPGIEWSKEQQMEFLQAANKEADHLTLLIKRLLDMSRIDSGKLALDIRQCKVSEILDSVSETLIYLTQTNPLKVSGLVDLPPVRADRDRLAEVIVNLVDNAVKFSAPGSPIEIEGEQKEGYIQISVRDHGIGMTPEVLANLFNRFYQAQQVVSGKTRGTGLGLAISKGIIEAHGGQIKVESQPGMGAKFSFSIPIEK